MAAALVAGWLLAIGAAAAPADVAAEAAARPANRAESFRALATRLGVGEGAVIADLGAGRGADTWLLADIVGPTGKVYSQEITEKMIESLKQEAEKRELPQVETVLGASDDPQLPEASADLIYMRQVYHHFAQPRAMLRGILRSLKPGGYLVIVDRYQGTLRTWVPVEVREREHHWTSEATVVREAREEGFAFVGCFEDAWHEPAQFVLVFRRPDAPDLVHADPDLPLPLPENSANLLLAERRFRRPAIVALGEARELIEPILARSAGPGLEIVLHEWATQKNERPPLPAGVDLPAVLAEKGEPELGPEPIDAVFFLDSYHLLFHGPALLAKLHEHLTPDGAVTILDRKASGPLSRREASHRRQIAPETVRQEMEAAGFALKAEAPAPAEDRFVLVFGKGQAD